MRSLGYGSVLMVLILSMSLAGSCNKTGSSTSSSSAGSGGTAAVSPTAFSYTTLAGATESSSKYLGKPLVVNFWADW